MRLACYILTCLVLQAGGSGGPLKPRRPRQAAPAAAQGPKLQTSITVTPSSMQFQSDDPDLGEIPALMPALVSWRGKGDNGMPWTMSVQATAPSFQNCPLLPVSAVRVTCQWIDQPAGTAGCAAPLTISSSPQVVASGGQVGGIKNYNVSLAFSLSDSWRYIAATNPQCTLDLTYIVDFP